MKNKIESKNGKNRVIDILMRRDGMSLAEAKSAIAECREALLSGDEYALEDYLGKECEQIGRAHV